jgi:hypothetical protein
MSHSSPNRDHALCEPYSESNSCEEPKDLLNQRAEEILRSSIEKKNSSLPKSIGKQSFAIDVDGSGGSNYADFGQFVTSSTSPSRCRELKKGPVKFPREKISVQFPVPEPPSLPENFGRMGGSKQLAGDSPLGNAIAGKPVPSSTQPSRAPLERPISVATDASLDTDSVDYLLRWANSLPGDPS